MGQQTSRCQTVPLENGRKTDLWTVFRRKTVDHLQTVRLPQATSRSGVHIEHLLLEADISEVSSVNVMHRSFCHSICNTTMADFLTWYIYFRFYYGKPQHQFFPGTLY